MIWLLVGASLALFALLCAGWYGASVLFRPPKRLPLTIFPKTFGFQHENVEFASKDGTQLRGWLIPAATATERSLVLCHGWGDNKGDLLQRTEFLRAKHNLFYFDFRSHGDSEGTKTSLCGPEIWDVAAALACLRRARPEWMRRLGVFGYSMGSAAGIWLTANNPEIKALVVESPFWSFNGVLYQWANNAYHIPYYPVLPTIYLMCRLRLGMNPEPLSPIHQIGRIRERPILILSGERDELMLPDTVERVFEKAHEPKELWMIPAAGHGKCREVAGAEYDRRVGEFFDRHL